MKTVYRGYEIEVKRDRCMGGWSQLYVSIFRIRDDRECLSFHTDDSTDVRTYLGYMRDRVDAELADADPWGEKANEYHCGYMQQRGAA